MNTVTQIKAHLLTIEAPSEIRSLPAWLMWRYEHHEGEARPRKIPYYASGAKRYGVQGNPDDRRQLATFEAARAAAARRGMDGVGFALMPEWGVVALDFDHCVSDGRIHPDVEALLGSSYAEFSPSGQGIRVFMKGNLGNRKAHGEPFGFETFSTRGFVTFTGNRLPITDLLGNEDTVAPVDDAVLALVRKRFTREEHAASSHDDPVLGLTEDEIQRGLAVLDPGMGHDDWLMVGMALHHETRGDGFDLWDAWSAGSDKYPGRDVLYQRWLSFGKTVSGPVVTAKSLVKAANELGAQLRGMAPPNIDGLEILPNEPEGERLIRFQFEPAHTFASAQGLPWIVKGVLPKAGLAVLYGASGAGKSFMALDLAMTIARGVPWRNRKVKQGRVAYIAAEGAEGFKVRLYAYAQQRSVDLEQIPFSVLNGAPNLMLLADAKDLALGVVAAGGADLIVVDTFAQVTPGANENAGEDIGKALGHCRTLHQRTGALVLLVHHSGKDQSKGARGWSGLKAAADAELEVVRTEAGNRTLRLSKGKDGVDNLVWGFKLDVVQVGVDEDLDPITSCVVEEDEVRGVTIARVLGPNEEVVNAVIQEMAGVQTTGIEVDAVVREALRRMPAPADGRRDTRKTRVRRAIESLCAGDDAPYWLDDGCISVA